MKLDTIKKLVGKRSKDHLLKMGEANISRKYFDSENDILVMKDPTDTGTGAGDQTGIRHADNRINHNFHQLITEQAVSYGFSIPPQFDVDDEKLNEEIRNALDAEGYFTEVVTELALESIHFGVAWIHYWKDKETKDFDYAVIPGDQIIPIYSQGLKRKLEGLLRIYVDENEEAEDIVVYEYWDKTYLYKYYHRGTTIGGTVGVEWHHLPIGNTKSQPTNRLAHGLKNIPFIPFYNGYNNHPNLFRYKKLIDAYDSVFSGYLNDVQDIQEIILVLTNYGGDNLKQFKEELKEFKAIKIDQMDDQDKSGVGVLQIEIPVEARNSILDALRQSIWDAGQGFKPSDETLKATSGVALDQMYSSIELKVKLMETRFRKGFTELVRAYLVNHQEKTYNEIKVNQDWRRTRVKSTIEMANTIAVLSNTTSKENLAKNNPIVPDWQAELRMKEEDDKKAMEQQKEMQNQFSQVGLGGNFANGKSGSQSKNTLESNNPSNNSKKIRKRETGKGVGNE